MNSQFKSAFPALALSFFCGVFFAAGLVVSGMTQPAKVIGFLNIGAMLDGGFPGAWDPSLAFVMGGAVLVTLLAFAITPRPHRQPWLARSFKLPTRTDVDLPLVLGAALFGVGWGLGGFCPGPALASVLIGSQDAVIFSIAMVAGMVMTKRWVQRN
ncbi:MAG: hypothetical protein RLZZ591_1281 [Pseudomonadota bacterium]|jgi:uncharacterized membrane protein YedE/YeeE